MQSSLHRPSQTLEKKSTLEIMKNSEEDDFFSIISDPKLILHEKEAGTEPVPQPQRYRSTYSSFGNKIPSQISYRIIPPDEAFEQLQEIHQSPQSLRADLDGKSRGKWENNSSILEQSLKNSTNKYENMMLAETKSVDNSDHKKAFKTSDLEDKTLQSKQKNSKQPLIVPSQTKQKLSQIDTFWIPALRGKCLFRHQLVDQYKKVQYQIQKGQLKISNEPCVDIAWIGKIKIIRSELDRPELKITYKYEQISKYNKAKILEHVIFFCDTFQNIYQMFSNLLTRKLSLKKSQVFLPISTLLTNDSKVNKIEGYIFKKSQHLKKWNQRYITINDSLKSYREEKEKATFEIKAIKEIWTRFQFFNGFLICKMHHKMEKTELGIPITNYINTTNSQNWLFFLCNLLQ